MLPDLSPSDATMYTCNVMISSNVSVLLIKQTNVASTHSLATRSKISLYINKLLIISYSFLYIVPSPLIDLQPANSDFTYYAGENLNLTCTSSVMDVKFNWTALNSSDNTQQPLILRNATVGIDTNVSIFMFRPIILSKVVVVEAVCVISYPENELVIGNKSTKLFTFKSEV